MNNMMVRGKIVDYNSFREKIYYIEKRELAIYTLLSLIMCSLFQIAMINDSRVIKDFFDIIRLIVAMILLMFVIHLKNITKRDIYGIIQIFLFTACIVFTVFLTPENQFQETKVFLKKLGYGQSYEFQFLNIVMMYCITAKYRYEGECSSDIYFEYFFLFILLFITGFITSRVDYNWRYYIYVLINTLFLVFTYKYLNTFKAFYSKKIDLFKINVHILTIEFIIRVLGNYIEISILVDLANILKLIIFISTVIAIITNITKENYNFIFKETINTNKNLEEINKEIINNNYKLEEAYRKLNDRQILYKRFLSCLPNPIVIINNNLRISYCNKRFLNIIGKDNLREVVNKTYI